MIWQARFEVLDEPSLGVLQSAFQNALLHGALCKHLLSATSCGRFMAESGLRHFGSEGMP